MGIEKNLVLVITIRWCGVYVDFVPAVVEGMVVFLFVASVADAGGLFVWVVEWYSADAAKDSHVLTLLYKRYNLPLNDTFSFHLCQYLFRQDQKQQVRSIHPVQTHTLATRMPLFFSLCHHVWWSVDVGKSSFCAYSLIVVFAPFLEARVFADWFHDLVVLVAAGHRFLLSFFLGV